MRIKRSNPAYNSNTQIEISYNLLDEISPAKVSLNHHPLGVMGVTCAASDAK